MNRNWNRATLISFVVLALSASGCDETDLVSIRIWLKSDHSGTIATSNLLFPADAGPLERASQGAVWQDRVNVACAAGTFDDLSKLRIEDIVFEAGGTPGGFSFVQVTLPRGPGVRWPGALSPGSTADRERVTKVFDPTGKAKNVGSRIKLEIHLPARVAAHGTPPNAPESEEEIDKERASLLLPLDTALKGNDPLVWHLTWLR